ncbi:acetate/propionate family kinase [Agaribacterium haliotis]|uniref:acetate/propionate family kinase n=1 Tax=Agaribacterium haliotis TaxID=2013869 RepID=UPI000BB54FE9|nr:acetate kinase [Agaribacterium haliotis]
MAESIVLVLNSGSSSLKFSLFCLNSQQALLSGLADRLGQDDPEATLSWKADGQKQSLTIAGADQADALKALLNLLKERGMADKIKACGHRVVHGGEYFYESVLVDDLALDKIKRCIELAPLHNPANALGIEEMQRLFPGLPQVAVFDTAFHQSMPKEAYLYALPYELYRDHGVRRYGAHGTSHKYVAQQAVKQLALDPDNHALVTAHLGNGCSATAVLNGHSVDTTMGMTPLEGLVMGTRSGDIDPSLHQFLSEKLNIGIADVTAMLNKKSGLLGVSELSNDMRTLCDAAEQGNEQADLAVHLFCYRLAKSICALAMPLGRLDALVFTGGIGENALRVRELTLAHLKLLGFELDPALNATHGRDNNGLISTATSSKAVVIATNEEWAIAQDTARLIGG